MLKHINTRDKFFMLKENAEQVTYTKEDFDKADDKMSICKVLVMNNTPFFSVLLKKLLIIPNIYIPTMATDGNAILYNPKFTNNLTEEECVFVIQHEIMHCALQHFARMDGKDLEKWNHATDYAINYMLKEMDGGKGIAVAPERVLYDAKYAEMTAEHIYEIMDDLPSSNMMKGPPQDSDCQSCGGSGEEQGDGDSGEGESDSGDNSQDGDGSGDGESDSDGEEGDGSSNGGSGEPSKKEPCKSCGGSGKQKGSGEGQSGVTPGNTSDSNVGGVVSPEELSKYYDDPDNPKGIPNKEQLEKAWEVSVKKAIKQSGDMPGNVKRMFGDILDPVINWKSQLKKFINNLAKRSRYKLYNRRHISRGTYLPGLKRDLNGITNIIVAIDTSGSINDEMLQRYLSEVWDILKRFDPEETNILYIDTEVANVDTIKKGGKPDKNAMAGGGGTAFKPAFDWVDKNMKPKDVSVFIYFTDLYGDTSFKKPKWHNKVIWALERDSRDLEVPFGKKLILDKNMKIK